MRTLMLHVGMRSASRAAASLLLGVSLIIIARDLGAERFGYFALFLGIGYFVASIATLGSATRILRLRAEIRPQGEIAGALQSITAIGSTISSVLVGFAGWIFVDDIVTLLAIVVVFSDYLCQYVVGYLSAYGRHTEVSVLVVLQRCTLAIPLVVGGVSTSVSILIPVAALIMYTLVTWLVFIPGTWAPWHAIYRTAKDAFGYWFSSVIANINQLEAPAVGLSGDPALVGNFGIASRLMSPLTIAIAALQSVFVPELSRQIGTPQFESKFRSFLGISVAYAIVLASLSPVLADLLVSVLGNEYRDARVLVFSVVVAAALSAISQALQAWFVTIGRPVRSAWIIGSGMAAGVVGIGVLGLVDPSLVWVVPIGTQAAILIGLIWMYRVTRRGAEATYAGLRMPLHGVSHNAPVRDESVDR